MEPVKTLKIPESLHAKLCMLRVHPKQPLYEVIQERFPDEDVMMSDYQVGVNVKAARDQLHFEAQDD